MAGSEASVALELRDIWGFTYIDATSRRHVPTDAVIDFRIQHTTKLDGSTRSVQSNYMAEAYTKPETSCVIRV